MPQRGWSKKRERQYDHIKQGLLERGEPEGEAEEIAARTVNKVRARAGETKQSSDPSRHDAARRGGLSSKSGADGRSFDQLYQEARALGIDGRSKMNKSQLETAVDRQKGRRTS